VTLQRPASRPRLEGERAREVLDVTLQLLSEVGYDKLTLDTVATRARAGKATLYRHWSSKAELVADAMSGLEGAVVLPDTGSLRGDLLELVGSRRFEPADARLMCGVSTAMSTDPELNRALRDRFVQPRLGALRRLLENGRARGEVDDDVDLELVASVLPAMMTFLGMIGGQPPSPEFAARVVDELVLPAVRPRDR
jgi:AcrR family transcriptional regulator